MRSRFRIDDAPGKALVQDIAASLDPGDLAAFFALRTAWCGGYPLIHDRLVTYGAFDDLLRALDGEKRLVLLPHALVLAETVPDQQFHIALYLLGDMIPDDGIRPRPPGFSDALLRIRLRAEKLSFLPNLTCTWESVALKSRCLTAGKDDPLSRYSPRQLEIDDSAWRRFFTFPLPDLGIRSLSFCRADFGRLRELLHRLHDREPGVRMLAYATRVENARYWVWRLPGASGTAHLARLVFLRQPEEGALRYGYWDVYRQFTDRWSAEEISEKLLNIEYSPHDGLRDIDSMPPRRKPRRPTQGDPGTV